MKRARSFEEWLVEIDAATADWFADMGEFAAEVDHDEAARDMARTYVEQDIEDSKIAAAVKRHYGL